MNIWFDLAELYYWPQYAPVVHELSRRGHSCKVGVHRRETNAALVDRFLHEQRDSTAFEVISEPNLGDFYAPREPDWIIFGNDNFRDFDALPKKTNTALLYHGIGVKSSYYDKGTTLFGVRFTEGHFRQKTLQTMYPDAHFQEVGFAKLDPLFNRDYFNFEPLDLNALGLSRDKPTLLYAPTFYPSSIERMPQDWPALVDDCNIIVKPHFFSWSNPRYSGQRARLKYWETFNNVAMAPADAISLLPYMDKADLLISEASSALFEFAALDKPVVWLDFLHLRWSYRGILKYRLKRRMDDTIAPYRGVALHVRTPKQLRAAVHDQLTNKQAFEAQRRQTSRDLLGATDGRASQRIANYLERR